MEEKKEDLIIAGKIHGTHGLKGFLKIEIFPPNFDLPEVIYIKDKTAEFKPLKVDIYDKRRNLIRFENYTDIEKAKKLKHRYFYVSSGKLPKLEKDQFYEFQLIGLDVIYDNQKIGKISKVDDRLPTVYLIIKCLDGKERHLPLIKEFIKDVDIENGRVIVELPEGWLEL